MRDGEVAETKEAQEAAEDLAELQFSPLAPEEAAELDDRVYLLGVRREYMNIR
jgi:hypothetical protein